MIIIPIKWLFHWEYTQHFQTNPYKRGAPILFPAGAGFREPREPAGHGASDAPERATGPWKNMASWAIPGNPL
jgi:hypothetical protein